MGKKHIGLKLSGHIQFMLAFTSFQSAYLGSINQCKLLSQVVTSHLCMCFPNCAVLKYAHL